MLEKFSYLTFGFVLGSALLLALTMVNNNSMVLSKTSRLNGTAAPAYNVAPTDFAMERFG